MAQLETKRHAALDRRPGLHRFEPSLQVREFVDVLPLPLPAVGPADQRHVCNGVFAGDERTILETDVHDAVEAVHFVDVTIDRVGQCFHRVVLEVVHLPRHRPDASHLPEQPLLDLDAPALIGGIKLAGLASEILQDRTRLKNRDRPSARPLRIHDCRHAIVWGYFQEIRTELLSFGYVHRLENIRQATFFQHN